MSKDLPTGSDKFREAMQSRKCIGSGATGSRGGFYPVLFKVDSPDNKADWSLWSYKPTVSILEACYLSLNIAPEVHDVLEREAKGIAIHEMHHKQARDIVELYKKIEKRVKIVVANHPDNGGELPIFRTFMHPSGTLVRLSEFGAWAKSIGWELPAEFPTGTSTDAHQQDTVTVTALKDILAAIKPAKSERAKKMLKSAQAFHDDNGRYPEGRELFNMGKDAHGYDDWETFRKTFVRYFSEAG